MVEPDSNYLAAGRANFSRNGFDGEFIQGTVAKGNWELDRFLKSRGISRVNILHVDIQGHEAELLDGGRDTLGKALVDYVFVSTHSQVLHRRIVSELAGFGYRIEVSSDFDNETTSFDGFVFAASQQAKPIFGGFTHFGRSKIATSRADDRAKAVLKARESTL